MIEPAVADQVVLPSVIAAPNWSMPLAVNCCVAWLPSAGTAGVTVMLVSVWFTVTPTLLVVDSPPASVIVTWKV